MAESPSFTNALLFAELEHRLITVIMAKKCEEAQSYSEYAKTQQHSKICEKAKCGLPSL